MSSEKAAEHDTPIDGRFNVLGAAQHRLAPNGKRLLDASVSLGGHERICKSTENNYRPNDRYSKDSGALKSSNEISEFSQNRVFLKVDAAPHAKSTGNLCVKDSFQYRDFLLNQIINRSVSFENFRSCASVEGLSDESRSFQANQSEYGSSTNFFNPVSISSGNIKEIELDIKERERGSRESVVPVRVRNPQSCGESCQLDSTPSTHFRTSFLNQPAAPEHAKYRPRSNTDVHRVKPPDAKLHFLRHDHTTATCRKHGAKDKVKVAFRKQRHRSEIFGNYLVKKGTKFKHKFRLSKPGNLEKSPATSGTYAVSICYYIMCALV